MSVMPANPAVHPPNTDCRLYWRCTITVSFAQDTVWTGCTTLTLTTLWENSFFLQCILIWAVLLYESVVKVEVVLTDRRVHHHQYCHNWIILNIICLLHKQHRVKHNYWSSLFPIKRKKLNDRLRQFVLWYHQQL